MKDNHVTILECFVKAFSKPIMKEWHQKSVIEGLTQDDFLKYCEEKTQEIVDKLCDT